MSFTRAPFARMAVLAGLEDFEKAFTYQDYLYELLADGSSAKPVTEQQWEAICDIIGPDRRMMYASNTKAALSLFEGRATAKAGGQ